MTNNWLFEAGYSFAEFYRKGGPPTGSPAQLAEDAIFSPAWVAMAQTGDSALNRNFPDRCAYSDGLDGMEHDPRATSGKRPQRSSRRPRCTSPARTISRSASKAPSAPAASARTRATGT